MEKPVRLDKFLADAGAGTRSEVKTVSYTHLYEVSNAFNSFYHETKILSEEDQAQKESFLQLLQLTRRVLETRIDLLGFSAPDRM